MRALTCGAALLLAISSCGAQQSGLARDAAAWRADLQFLARELPSRHINAFHTVTRERFDSEVKTLDAAIPKLNDDQVLVGLMRIVALVGDGHTHLDLPPSWPRYPIELAWFGSELCLIAAATANPAVVGARVTGVAGLNLDSAMTLLSRLVPRGENDLRTRLTATILLASPRVLHGLGLSPTHDGAAFALRTSDGRSLTESVSPASPRDNTAWRFAAEHPPLWLQRLGEPWWATVLPDSSTVYLAFSRYPAAAEFEQRCAELGRLLDQSRARRIVIDLRRNGGGDFTLVQRFLIPVLKARHTINHAGGVYVLTGAVTFSAAMVNTIDLKRELNAMVVGEPTGARPNSYSELGTFTLPNSGLRVSYSTRYYKFGADSDSAVEPDRRIEPTWQDFLSGRDPVLDWILAQKTG